MLETIVLLLVLPWALLYGVAFLVYVVARIRDPHYCSNEEALQRLQALAYDDRD